MNQDHEVTGDTVETAQRPKIVAASEKLTEVAEKLTAPVAFGSIAAALVPEFSLVFGLLAAGVGYLFKLGLDRHFSVK